MRLTDDDLREAARDDLDMTGNHAAMARELLVARKVVEVARCVDSEAWDFEPELEAALTAALDAYDREVER